MIGKLDKVVRDGKVAVLYSPGYGAGWSTWADDEVAQKALFAPEIVHLVESNQKELITDEYCKQIFNCNHFYTGGARDLRIVWIEQGQQFRVTEYDGSESIEYAGNDYWEVA